jgi:hypothetical protein
LYKECVFSKFEEVLVLVEMDKKEEKGEKIVEVVVTLSSFYDAFLLSLSRINALS